MRHFVKVLRVAKRHAVWMFVALISMLIVAVTTVFSYNLIRPVYDQVLGAGGAGQTATGSTGQSADFVVANLDALARYGRDRLAVWMGDRPSLILLLLLFAIVLKNCFSFLARFSMAQLGLATVRDLRNRIFQALLGQSQAYFNSRSTGSLVSRVVSDVQLVNEALAERFGDFVQDTLTILVLFAYVFSLDVRLAVATFVLAPLLVTPVVYFSRRLRLRARQAQERMAELTTTMDETVRGMRVVQAYGMQEFEKSRFYTASQSHFFASLRARAIQAANAPVMEIIGVVGAIALIAYASSKIAEGTMTLGDFSAFLLGVYGTYNPIKRLNKFNLAAQQADVAAQRIFEVIEAQVDVVDAAGATELESVGSGIELVGVEFSYSDQKKVLDCVDLCIPRGATVALVGASGAGKSTVAQLILRFWDVDAGAVVVGGVDVRSLTLSSLRSAMGLVTQETILFNDSVRINMTGGEEGFSDEAIRRAAEAAFADRFIEELPEGFETRVGEGGVLLSGGQRQRIAIARALLRNPPILVLDEATSSLDSESEAVVQEALERLMEGRTTLVIAHRLSTVRGADLIAVMDNGRIVEQGSHDELLNLGGTYVRLLSAQGSSGKVTQ
ncbi:MAG: ABC transporter ATP-binding protein [bacterium]|nr:ABC transporter ATP-binding protein [bacterium]